MRFNGLTLAPLLRGHGIDSTHMIWKRDTSDPVIRSFSAPYTSEINALYAKIENITSMQSVLYQNGEQILRDQSFAEADLVHLHLIHTGYLNLLDLRMITQAKPTVWTIHDPWAFTGHCVYPLECERWKIGCGHCPDLDINFPMRYDNTDIMFDYKKFAYSQANFEVIVASEWMKLMAEASPLFENVHVHKVPFGLDLEFFARSAGAEIRRAHEIADDEIVLCFRAQEEFKGLEYIRKALRQLQTTAKICLLTVGNIGLLNEFADKYRLVEFGWVNDPALLRDIMDACDIFLMPSIAEAFGVMAIEAMACSKPVICFEGTSLPEVTNAPEIGVAVPMKDHHGLSRAISFLINNEDERQKRGIKGLEFAKRNYDERQHAIRMASLYRGVLSRAGQRRRNFSQVDNARVSS
ncbi:glycosyltransferase involved in cell wall biosynthesis [Methylobacterium sp. OAE515]|uniref:glycosyltransferase n=1 Tax=Methylobacterium sp. OAE515 TaxID=2817895 RepID=UPI0019D9C598